MTDNILLYKLNNSIKHLNPGKNEDTCAYHHNYYRAKSFCSCSSLGMLSWASIRGSDYRPLGCMRHDTEVIFSQLLVADF